MSKIHEFFRLASYQFGNGRIVQLYVRTGIKRQKIENLLTIVIHITNS